VPSCGGRQGVNACCPSCRRVRSRMRRKSLSALVMVCVCVCELEGVWGWLWCELEEWLWCEFDRVRGLLWCADRCYGGQTYLKVVKYLYHTDYYQTNTYNVTSYTQVGAYIHTHTYIHTYTHTHLLLLNYQQFVLQGWIFHFKHLFFRQPCRFNAMLS